MVATPNSVFVGIIAGTMTADQGDRSGIAELSLGAVEIAHSLTPPGIQDFLAREC